MPLSPLWAYSEFSGTGSVTRWRLTGRVQRLEERDEGGRLRGTQVFSIGRHVAAALNYLADELIRRELYSNTIQLRSALPSRAAQRVAVVTLLSLKDERPLPLDEGCRFVRSGYLACGPGSVSSSASRRTLACLRSRSRIVLESVVVSPKFQCFEHDPSVQLPSFNRALDQSPRTNCRWTERAPSKQHRLFPLTPRLRPCRRQRSLRISRSQCCLEGEGETGCERSRGAGTSGTAQSNQRATQGLPCPERRSRA